MSYSNIIRLLGVSAAVAGFAASVLLVLGSFRGGAALALACLACAACLGIIMIRRQSRASATMSRGLGRRLDKAQEELSGLKVMLDDQAVLMRSLEAQLTSLEAIPTSLRMMSGVVAETQSSVLQNLSSTHAISDRLDKTEEQLGSLSKMVDTITVDVSALRNSSVTAHTDQMQQLRQSTDKSVIAGQVAHDGSVVAEENSVKPLGKSDGLARVLTLGRDPLEIDIEGLRTAALFPGAIPSRASLPPSAVLVVDESGFSRGVWKSFGGPYDDYLLSELIAVRRLVADGRVRTITMTSEDTPERFRLTRTWGVSASNPGEANQLLRVAAKQ